MRLTLFLLAALFAGSAAAQVGPLTGVVQAGGIVQNYSTGDGQAVRETSVPFGGAVRLQSGIGFNLRGLYASASGDNLETISGLADVQVGASYRRRVSGASVEVALGASVPGRGSTLTDAGFATATAISFDDYAFDVPSLGQGATVSPSLAIVVPAGRGLALGIGGAFYARQSFVPFEGNDTEYSPADEFVVTGGLTAQTGRASTFALDATLTAYSADEYDGQSFSPGNRLSGTARWQWGGGTVRGRLLAHYRHVFDGEVGRNSQPVIYQRPEHAVLATGIGVFHQGAGLELTVGARYYGIIQRSESTQELLNVLGDQQVLVDVGVAPSVEIAPNIRVQALGTYTFSVAEAAGALPLTGFRAGAGLRAGF